MAIQPIKKSGTYQKPRSKTVKKKAGTPAKKKKSTRSARPHPKYGTSKLEKRFEKDFLKKLGLNYETQFYAKDIKRYYDFYLTDYKVLLEIDGDYYHSYGVLYEDMTPMQKHNRRVDEIKTEWAALHGIALLRIWEHDINNNPVKVMEMLKEFLGIAEKKKRISDEKKKRH